MFLPPSLFAILLHLLFSIFWDRTTVRTYLALGLGVTLLVTRHPQRFKRPMTLSSFLCVADKQNISNSTTNKLVYYGTKRNYADEKHKLTVCKKFWEVSTPMTHNILRLSRMKSRFCWLRFLKLSTFPKSLLWHDNWSVTLLRKNSLSIDWKRQKWKQNIRNVAFSSTFLVSYTFPTFRISRSIAIVLRNSKGPTGLTCTLSTTALSSPATFQFPFHNEFLFRYRKM
jgi:hypothetical protein